LEKYKQARYMFKENISYSEFKDRLGYTEKPTKNKQTNKQKQVKTKSAASPCPSYVYVTWVFSSSDKWGGSIIIKLSFPLD
jgi:hypothetical protein